MAANEASAVGSVRTINTAQLTFCDQLSGRRQVTNLGGTGATASNAGALLIDNVLSAGTLSDHSRAGRGWYDRSARFFSDQSGVIRSACLERRRSTPIPRSSRTYLID